MNKCPICETAMEQDNIAGRYGGKFVISHCPQCSGIWGTAEAVLQMNPESAGNLPGGEDSGGKGLQRRGMSPLCPGCRHEMEEIQSKEALPAGLRFLYCAECQSLWFDDKNQLMIFMNILESKRREFKMQENERRRKSGKKEKGKGIDFLNLRYPFSWDIFEK